MLRGGNAEAEGIVRLVFIWRDTEAFHSYTAEQSGKEAALLKDFTPENMEAALSVKP